MDSPSVLLASRAAPSSFARESDPDAYEILNLRGENDSAAVAMTDADAIEQLTLATPTATEMLDCCAKTSFFTVPFEEGLV